MSTSKCNIIKKNRNYCFYKKMNVSKLDLVESYLEINDVQKKPSIMSGRNIKS